MKKHTEKSMTDRLVLHPYESNPNYFSRINFFYFSPDKKMVTYYWDAPVGEVPLSFDQFNEMIFLQSGRLEIVQNGVSVMCEPGDCVEISNTDGLLLFRVIEDVKAVGYVYPIDEAEYYKIKSMMTPLAEE